RVVAAVGDQGVALGPVHLQVAGPDRRDPEPALERAGLRAQPHARALAQAEPRGVLGADQHRVALGAGQRVALVPHHAVELLAAARADPEAALRDRRLLGRIGTQRERHGRAVRAAVGREPGPAVALAQARAAPLDLVALLR